MRPGEFSHAYCRDVWGERMAGYRRCRDPEAFAKLDATQLVKHAFGLRTAVNKVPQQLSRTYRSKATNWVPPIEAIEHIS